MPRPRQSAGALEDVQIGAGGFPSREPGVTPAAILLPAGEKAPLLPNPWEAAR